MSVAAANLEALLKRMSVGEDLVRRNALYYGGVQRQLELLRRTGLSERRAWTEQRLHGILLAAGRTPYGRRLGSPRRLSEWPLLAKDAVRAHPGDFQSRWRWFSARASTGGTTGTPLQLIRSPRAVVAEQAVLDRMMMELQVEPRTARIASLRADSIKDPSDTEPPYWTFTAGGRRLLLSSNHLSAATLPDFLGVLRDFNPQLLWASPTPLESLCRLLASRGERLHIPASLTSSEMFRPASWRLAQTVLGCATVDYYGQAERVGFAYAHAPESYFFLPGYAHVELVAHSENDEGRMYEVVGTSLWNTAMPLVRYRTGDLVCLPPRYGERELEEVTLGIRPFAGILGRAQDVLLAADGRGILTGISHIPRDVEHVVRLQIVQESLRQVSLCVLPDAGFSSADAEHLLHNARLKIPDSMDVRLEVVTSLLRTARGKTPFVVHSAAVQEAFRRAGFHVAAK